MEFRKRYSYNPKLDLLGKGGFSRVFKANDVLLEREVALKVFNPEQSAQYDLISEIKKVIKFQQENLCRYYDVAILESVNAFGEDEQVQVGVMEYLDGGELKSYLKKNPQHLNKLLCDVLKGLAYLHKRSIIHRDLKPQNILIKIEDDGPVAKITDFGISKAMDSTQENASALVGTVEYMAPEQFNPAKYGINGQISTHIDLWSFGIMVYELIEGENLFGSRSKGIGAEIVMNNILNEDYTEKLASLPAPYNQVVGSCLKKMASQRAASGEVLLAMLSGNVTDSRLFSGLSNQPSAQHLNDETILIPGNLQGLVGETTDQETQLISYNISGEDIKTSENYSVKIDTPVEKVSGNIFGITEYVPIPIKDISVEVADFSKATLSEDKPVKIEIEVKEQFKPFSQPPVPEKEEVPSAVSKQSIPTPIKEVEKSNTVVEQQIADPIEIKIIEQPDIVVNQDVSTPNDRKSIEEPDVVERVADSTDEKIVEPQEVSNNVPAPDLRTPEPKVEESVVAPIDYKKDKQPIADINDQVEPIIKDTPNQERSESKVAPQPTQKQHIKETVTQKKKNKEEPVAQSKLTETPEPEIITPVTPKVDIDKTDPASGNILYKDIDQSIKVNKPFTLNDALGAKANHAGYLPVSEDQSKIVPQQKAKSNLTVIIAIVIGIVVIAGGIFLFTQNKTDESVSQKQSIENQPITPLANKKEVEAPVPSKNPTKIVSGLSLPNGTYAGRTKNGIPDGKGELRFANGNSYNGGFSDGQFSGRGTLVTADGEKYVGNWSQGKKTNGTLYYADGTLYRGSFKGDLKHGNGKFMFKDATYYEGEFKNDQFNGQGKIFTPSGELIKSGIFKDGEMIGE